jgi:hypothetical protein
MNINSYHWVWYLLGFLCLPRLTFMIFLTIYFKEMIPLCLFIVGWIIVGIDLLSNQSK